jgi:multiple sugar transport system permease protein
VTPSRGYRVFIHVAALVVSVAILAPFLWLFVASVASPSDLLARPLHFIPDHVSFHRYSEIFTAHGDNVSAAFREAFVNSLIVATGTVLISVSVGVFGAYAIARLRFRAQQPLLLLFLSTYMVPPIALVIPMYLVMVRLHLLFQTIPKDLEDAAQVEGCTRIGALFRVILPLARPGLLATILFAFLIAWDEFLYALIFTSTTASKTIPVAIAEFTGRYETDFGLQAAGGVLAALPPVVIATVFQRYIVGGLARGAVKG